MAVDILLTVLTVIFSLMVVFSKRTVVSALALLMTLLCVGGIYFQLGSVFLSAVQVLVNAGAIAILFVFVMMLINLEQFPAPKDKHKGKLVASIFTILVAMGVLTLVVNNNLDFLSSSNLTDSSMKALFQKLFDIYFLPFELATVLLLASIIAVVVISSNPKKNEVK